MTTNEKQGCRACGLTEFHAYDCMFVEREELTPVLDSERLPVEQPQPEPGKWDGSQFIKSSNDAKYPAKSLAELVAAGEITREQYEWLRRESVPPTEAVVAESQDEKLIAKGIPESALFWLKNAKNESNSMVERLFYMENAYNHVVNALVATTSPAEGKEGETCGHCGGELVTAFGTSRHADANTTCIAFGGSVDAAQPPERISDGARIVVIVLSLIERNENFQLNWNRVRRQWFASIPTQGIEADNDSLVGVLTDLAGKERG